MRLCLNKESKDVINYLSVSYSQMTILSAIEKSSVKTNKQHHVDFTQTKNKWTQLLIFYLEYKVRSKSDSLECVYVGQI